MDPFKPAAGQTVNIDVSASSQSVQVTATGTSGLSQVRIMNNGSATVWIEHGISAPTASLTTSFPVGSGACEVMTLRNPCFIAAIAAGSTGKVYFTPGEGI